MEWRSEKLTRTWKTTGHGLRNGYADQRKTFIQDTLEGVDLDTTSRKIDVNIETAFNTRHRLLCIMEKELENEVLAGEVELDETFVGASRKSFSMEDDAGFEMAVDRARESC